MALPEGIPQYTLGWGVMDWCSSNLHNPDTVGGDKDSPWVFRLDQVLFILWFYAVNEYGEWIYAQAYRERAKGTGKSPMVAAIGCAEFAGPVAFSHFACEHGHFRQAHCDTSKAVGKENVEAAVWLAACSEAGTDHTYGYILGMLTGPASSNYNLDVGATRVLQNGNSRKILKQVTASPASLQGPRPSYVICEETQEWTPGKDGPKLMRMIELGLSKTHGRSIQVTNAPEPGMGTVAEAAHKAYKDFQEGLIPDPHMLFDTFMIRVEDVYDEEQALAALSVMYKDAPWMPPHLTYQRFFSQNLTEVDVRRFYFNEIVPPNDLWIKAQVWKDAEHGKKLKKADLISVGFRFRKNAAAIVAVRLKDQALFVLKKWERPPDAGRLWEVPYREVDNQMRIILDKHNVYNVMANPKNMEELVGRWSADYDGDVIVEEMWLNQRQKWANAIDMFETAILTKRLTHDGDADLARHVSNCFVEEVTQGRLIRSETENSNRYIVIAEAAVLAMKAYDEAVEDGALGEGPDDIVFSF